MLIAVCSVAVFKRMQLPPILAYLFAGVLAGPQLLGLYSHPQEMHLLAEVGIVFLLFLLVWNFPSLSYLPCGHWCLGLGLGKWL